MYNSAHHTVTSKDLFIENNSVRREGKNKLRYLDVTAKLVFFSIMSIRFKHSQLLKVSPDNFCLRSKTLYVFHQTLMPCVELSQSIHTDEEWAELSA